MSGREFTTSTRTPRQLVATHSGVSALRGRGSSRPARASAASRSQRPRCSCAQQLPDARRDRRRPWAAPHRAAPGGTASECRAARAAAPARRGARTPRRATVATISAPKPAVRLSSCTTRQRPVFFTDASTAARSHGAIVRRSMQLHATAELLRRLGAAVHHRAPRHEREVGAVAHARARGRAAARSRRPDSARCRRRS